jgi:hypothetical protein
MAILTRFVCVLAASLLLTGQLAAQEPAAASGKPQEKTEKTEKKEKKTPEEKLKENVKKAKKLSHELEMAQLELQVADLEVTIKSRGANAGVEKSTRALELAEAALKSFTGDVAPMELEQAKIRLDRSRHSADHAKDELAELKAMYKADEFAEMTKELVLKRGERRLELALRSLKVEERRLAHLQTSEHPRRKKELVGKVRDAKHALEKAQLENKKVGIEIRILKSKAVFKAEELERDLKDVRGKIEKAGQKQT